MAPDALPNGGPPSLAWKYQIPLGKKLFDFYPSLGDVTISTATNIAVENNGRMKVVRYGKLTVNALLTVDNPCRGLVILCDGLVIGAAGSISMTGKGAVFGQANLPEFPLVDIILPDVLTIQSTTKQYADFLSLVRANGICLFDRGYFEGRPGNACGFTVTQPGTGFTVVSASGCGAGGAYAQGGQQYYRNGGAGGAGSSGGMGGGSGGNAGIENIVGISAASGRGGAGTPYGSGAGGDGAYNGYEALAARYSMAGLYGGASLVAGLLIILVRGNVTIASGGMISSNGSPGTYGQAGAVSSWDASGNSGGGSVFLGYGGTLTNNGSIVANGGQSGLGALSGGAGSVQTKTFAQLGAAWQ